MRARPAGALRPRPRGHGQDPLRDTAERHLREALRLSATEESVILVLSSLAMLARAARQSDELERAALLWAVVSAEGKSLPA